MGSWIYVTTIYLVSFVTHRMLFHVTGTQLSRFTVCSVSCVQITYKVRYLSNIILAINT